MKRRLIAVLGLRHLLVTAIFVSTGMTLAVVALTAGLPRPLLKFSGGSGDILRDVLH